MKKEEEGKDSSSFGKKKEKKMIQNFFWRPRELFSLFFSRPQNIGSFLSSSRAGEKKKNKLVKGRVKRKREGKKKELIFVTL